MNTAEAPMTRHANPSTDGLYRWSLHREWRDLSDLTQGPRWVTFVMLNPSTADGIADDPTIRRCIGFARTWGATGLAVVNLYAFRATSPAELWKAEDPVGRQNDEFLTTFFDMAASYRYPIIAAWGAHARPDRVAQVLRIPGAERLQALGVTKSGAPRHPLYLRGDARPTPWLGARTQGAGR
ncbi:MAG TPA: DUF1643 domain-containing protein [Nocardioides sp.]